MSANPAQAHGGRAWRIAAAVALVMSLVVVAENVDWVSMNLGLRSHGDYGFFYVRSSGTRLGDGIVSFVRPASPAAAAGIAVGDVVKSPRPWELGRVPAAGDRVTVDIVHGGLARTVTLTAAPSRLGSLDGVPIWAPLLACLGFLPASLMGVFVLARSRAQPAAVLLGVALTSYGFINVNPGPTFSALAISPAVTQLNKALQYALYPAVLAFGLWMVSPSTGRAGRWRRSVALGYASFFAVIWAIFARASLGWSVPMWSHYATDTRMALSVAGLTGSLVLIVAGWIRSPAGEKRRFALLTAALVFILADQTFYDVGGLLQVQPDQFTFWPTLILNVLAGVVAPVLFAYAILRHRILDLGFALNRTLVYSAVSAILLGAFGLIEWAVDHFAKVEGREQNALIDAAIALGVFLAFHRVRDFVEKTVEALFFRRWQEKEAELRRFVADAAFVTRRDALLKSFAAALARFADGAACALYWKAEEGGFVRAASELPGAARMLDADDPALVRLRAERTPVEPPQVGSTLPAELACPMVHRGEVIGFALMAGREPGVAFRPDEEELLGWATLQVGLDLHALEVEQLQAQVVRLEHQLEGARLAAQPA